MLKEPLSLLRRHEHTPSLAAMQSLGVVRGRGCLTSICISRGFTSLKSAVVPLHSNEAKIVPSDSRHSSFHAQSDVLRGPRGDSEDRFLVDICCGIDKMLRDGGIDVGGRVQAGRAGGMTGITGGRVLPQQEVPPGAGGVAVRASWRACKSFVPDAEAVVHEDIGSAFCLYAQVDRVVLPVVQMLLAVEHDVQDLPVLLINGREGCLRDEAALFLDQLRQPRVELSGKFSLVRTNFALETDEDLVGVCARCPGVRHVSEPGTDEQCCDEAHNEVDRSKGVRDGHERARLKSLPGLLSRAECPMPVDGGGWHGGSLWKATPMRDSRRPASRIDRD